MKLWIRSQDRENIIKVETLELIYDCLCSDEVQLIHIDSDKGRVGSYSTKERALEVLDEIQDLINDISDGKMVGCVYEMPKEAVDMYNIMQNNYKGE